MGIGGNPFSTNFWQHTTRSKIDDDVDAVVGISAAAVDSSSIAEAKKSGEKGADECETSRRSEVGQAWVTYRLGCFFLKQFAGHKRPAMAFYEKSQ